MYKVKVTNKSERTLSRGNRVFAPLVEDQEVVVSRYHLVQLNACEDLSVEVLDDDYQHEAERESLPRAAGAWTLGAANGPSRFVGATENAQKAAARLDVGLAGITGSGMGGEITEEDVLAHYVQGVERPIHVDSAGNLISGTGGYVHNAGDNGETNSPADKGTEAGKDKGSASGNDKGAGKGKSNTKANGTSEG